MDGTLFTLIGLSVNMDSTFLYESVTALFIAQLRDIQLGLIRIIIMSITTTALSIGAEGILEVNFIPKFISF